MLADNLEELPRQNSRSLTSATPASDEQPYFVIPLSVQREGELYIVGNSDMGEFYQFPREGLEILDMLGSGETAASIRSRIGAVDVDGFLNQLADIGFIYPEMRRAQVMQTLRTAAQDTRRTFRVDPIVARAIFSPPMLACYLAVVLYACFDAFRVPELRLNVNSFYAATYRTPLLVMLIILSLMHTVMHEFGHMLAAARHGVKSKYGIGNRLWNIVAESDLTGILTLPKSQRYLPMLAGLLVDVLVISILTILLDVISRYGAGPFVIQVVQALVLEIVIGIAWQFNVFVKTDIYFVICNYLSYPDLDNDARIYLRGLLYRVTCGLVGRQALTQPFGNLMALRIFSAIWVLGRIFSLCILFGVFLPTIWQYLLSAAKMLSGQPGSPWMAVDTAAYSLISLTVLGAGVYMWLKHR